MQNHASVMKHLGTGNIQESNIIVQIISFMVLLLIGLFKLWKVCEWS